MWFFFCKPNTAYEMRISDWSSDVCSSALAARRHPHHRADDFAQPLVGQAEHRAFLNVGVCIDRRLDLGATDILAAADDDVLLAVDDEQILVGVEIAEVAGAEIAIGEKGGLGRLRVVPIAVEIADGPDAHLARLALRQDRKSTRLNSSH